MYESRKGLEVILFDLADPTTLVSLIYRLRQVEKELDRRLSGVLINLFDTGTCRNSHKPTRDLSPPRELIEAPLHLASHPPLPPRLPVHLPEALRGPFLRDPFALSLHLRQPHLLASPATPAMTPLIAAARTAAAVRAKQHPPLSLQQRTSLLRPHPTHPRFPVPL